MRALTRYRRRSTRGRIPSSHSCSSRACCGCSKIRTGDRWLVHRDPLMKNGCVFCGTAGKIIAEHVLPKWLSEFGLTMEPSQTSRSWLNRSPETLGTRTGPGGDSFMTYPAGYRKHEEPVRRCQDPITRCHEQVRPRRTTPGQRAGHPLTNATIPECPTHEG
jgi:hypothetical protein